MAYLALYRKYRPTTFDSLLGQDHIVKTLVNQIKGDRLGHAYLFTGTRGTGKTSAAKIFAKAINCQDNVNGSPCGKCEACLALSDSSNIDVIEIDAASNNGVNEIRDLREKVQYPPVSCKYKVYIIDEVHMLTGAAFNALLKTLEEPPKHAVFILATTEVHKIPATILSRCMRFDFKLIPYEKIAQLISNIYDEQGKAYEKEAVVAIAKAGEGSIRDALSIADIAISYSTSKLTYNDVMEILGSSNRDLLLEFIGYVLNGKTGQILSVINDLSALGKSMGILTKDITSTLRDLLIVKTCDNAQTILALPQLKFNEYVKISNNTSEEKLLRALEVFTDAENALKYTLHPRVVFETAAIKASRPQDDYNIDALITRIKDLELKLANGITVAVQSEKSIVKDNENIPAKTDNKRVEECKKLKISELSIGDLKGKLLFNLRKNGSEMLWNIVQGIELSVSKNCLIFTCESDNDIELLNKHESKTRIFEALEEFEDFELIIKLSAQQKSLSEVDDAADRVKKIFGDDIVIIK